MEINNNNFDKEKLKEDLLRIGNLFRIEEFTYTWEIKMKDGYSHFIDYGEDLVKNFFKRLSDMGGFEFIAFKKDLIVRVDEIISIEKVSE